MINFPSRREVVIGSTATAAVLIGSAALPAVPRAQPQKRPRIGGALGPDMAFVPVGASSQGLAVIGEPGSPLSTSVAVKPNLLNKFAVNLGEPAIQGLPPTERPAEMATLRITGVHPPEDPRAYVRVSLNCPYLIGALAVAFCVSVLFLAGQALTDPLAKAPGGVGCDRGKQTVAERNSGTGSPRFGPAGELIVPLDFSEVDVRLSDPAVRANQKPAQLRLRINDVKIYDRPAIGMRIFFDTPDAATKPYDTLPGYVESFAFFPLPTGTASGETVGSFLVDLDEAVSRLAEAALLPPTGHSLTIIPIDTEGRPSGRVAIGSSEVLRS
jgi:hypothetical protein